jgi:hypothetical protein
MNQIKHALLLVLAVGMVGCSPKVTSEMLTNDFEPQPTNYVMIIGAADELPAGTGAIGHVVVNGRSASVRKQYGRMVSLAVQETARKGGNVLVIDTVDAKKNSVKATMGLTKGQVDHSLTLSPFRLDQLEAMTAIRRKPAPVAIEEVAEVLPEETILQDTVALQEDVASTDRWYTDDAVVYPKIKKEKDVFFKMSVGPVKTTSEVYADDGKPLSHLGGMGVALTYGRFTSSSWGWGLDSFFSYTDVNETRGSRTYKGSYTLGYVGLCGILRLNIVEKLRFDLSLGLGAAYYNDPGNAQLGLGSKADLGLELMLTDGFGLGIESVGFASSFSAPSGVHLEKNERYGYDQSAWMLTARYYF